MYNSSENSDDERVSEEVSLQNEDCGNAEQITNGI